MIQEFIQIVSSGDNLHQILIPIFWENKKKNKKHIINIRPAELAHCMLSTKDPILMLEFHMYDI